MCQEQEKSHYVDHLKKKLWKGFLPPEEVEEHSEEVEKHSEEVEKHSEEVEERSEEYPIPLLAFQDLTGEEVRLRRWEAGANILRLEDKVPGVHIIVDGSVVIWKPLSVNTAGRLYIGRRFAGELIGEMEVLSPGGTTLGAASAATEAYTLHMEADYFQKQIVEKHSKLHLWLANQLITKIRDTNRHFEAVLMRSAEARIADDLLLQARRIGEKSGNGTLIPFSTQKALSDYLHTDVASVSRVLTLWQKNEVITKGDNFLIIHDFDVLESARDR